MILQEHKFCVSGIMCHGWCGTKVEEACQEAADTLIEQGCVPSDTQILVDSEPAGTVGDTVFSVCLVSASLASSEKVTDNAQTLEDKLHLALQHHITAKNFGFAPYSAHAQVDVQSGLSRWTNLAVGGFSLMLILGLGLALPVSLPLTVILSLIALGSTAFCGRSYFREFWQQIKQKRFSAMSTGITTGWGASAAHTIYHGVTMPAMSSAAMLGMNYLMPVGLFMTVNGLELFRESILRQAAGKKLSDRAAFLPQLADSYEQVQLPAELCEQFKAKLPRAFHRDENLIWSTESIQRQCIEASSVIKVPRGQCFPADCILLSEDTLVDSSVVDGELSTHKYYGEQLAGGSINLGDEVLAWTVATPYHSALNQVLLRGNRAFKPKESQQEQDSRNNFAWGYAGMVAISLAAALVAPYLLGVLGVGLALQNLTGVLFAICPCTIAFAHFLPKFARLSSLLSQGIKPHNPGLSLCQSACNTVVLDKTGTLTSGRCLVKECTIASAWTKRQVALLEARLSACHPVARAIIAEHEGELQGQADGHLDSNHRGLVGRIGEDDFVIGNAALLGEHGVMVEEGDSEGLTPVYVAKNGELVGHYLLEHELRAGVVEQLQQLRAQGKRLILITGDTPESAQKFNQQLGGLFLQQDLHAGVTPSRKETKLGEIMANNSGSPSSVMVVGDGVNDALMLKRASEEGAISCSISSGEKAAFFADMSLNGSLSYLMHHNALNDYSQTLVRQNQALLLLSGLSTLGCLICFSLVGLAVPAILPLLLMATTTLGVVGNSTRIGVYSDCLLSEAKPNLLQRFIASHSCFAMGSVGLGLLLSGVLTQTVLAGGLAMPSIAFAAGVSTAVASASVLTGGIFVGVVAIGLIAYTAFRLYKKRCVQSSPQDNMPTAITSSIKNIEVETKKTNVTTPSYSRLCQSRSVLHSEVGIQVSPNQIASAITEQPLPASLARYKA